MYCYNASNMLVWLMTICFIIIRISAMRRIVKSTRNMKKVVCTVPAVRLERATVTGSRSWIAQGWRPTSATIQPADGCLEKSSPKYFSVLSLF